MATGRTKWCSTTGFAPAERGWFDRFFPALLANSRAQGKIWSVPFQRSTVVLYWNKEAFRAAGLATRTLAKLIDHIQRHDGVWLARRIDIARHWKATHPYDAATAFVWR